MMSVVVTASLTLRNHVLSKSHLYLLTLGLIMPPSSVPEKTFVGLVR